MQSVDTAKGTFASRSRSIGGRWLFAQKIVRAGQQHRHRARSRHRRHALGIGVFEVIGRQCAVLGGERGAVHVGELIGVQLDRQAVLAGGDESARHQRRGEGHLFAIRIEGVGKFTCRHGGNQFRAQPIHIAARVAGVLGRHGMRAEVRGRDRQRAPRAQRAPGLQHAQLGVQIQSVARLDLQSRHAFGQQRIDARQRAVDQLLQAGGARRLHRRENPAAGARNALVAFSGQATLDLRGAIARMHDVGMAINEPRGHQPAAGIEHFGLRRSVAAVPAAARVPRSGHAAQRSPCRAAHRPAPRPAPRPRRTRPGRWQSSGWFRSACMNTRLPAPHRARHAVLTCCGCSRQQPRRRAPSPTPICGWTVAGSVTRPSRIDANGNTVDVSAGRSKGGSSDRRPDAARIGRRALSRVSASARPLDAARRQPARRLLELARDHVRAGAAPRTATISRPLPRAATWSCSVAGIPRSPSSCTCIAAASAAPWTPTAPSPRRPDEPVFP